MSHGGVGSVAVTPEGPFPLLAMGQSDLVPQHESVENVG